MKVALALACGLALAPGCKTDSQAPATKAAQSPKAAPTTPAGSARSAHLDLPAPRPLLNPDGTDRDDKRAAFDEIRRERMKQWDTDGDGKISPEERAAMNTQRLDGMRARLDHNGDGKLTPDELSKTRWFRGDATKADANHDGDISSQELKDAFDTTRFGRGKRPQFRTEAKPGR